MMMKTIQKLTRWAVFFVLWILVTLAGFVVDRFLFRMSGIPIKIIEGLEFWIGAGASQFRIFEIAASGILGLIDGIIIGLFQWIVLRKIFRRALWWVPVTGIGTAFGVMAFWLIVSLLNLTDITLEVPLDSIFVLGLLDAILAGIFIGFFQWILLSRNVRGHGWWVLVSSIASIGAWFIRLFINPGVAFVAYGMVTGFVLAIMLVDREIRLQRQAVAASAFLGARLANAGGDRPKKERIKKKPKPTELSSSTKE
jgi:hypothetical protein